MTSDDGKAAFEAVRAAALPGVWSQGVRLVREGAVRLDESSESEWVFRVRPSGRPAASTAVVYPRDEEWTCDCGGRNDPCEHVVAAVIAVKEGVAAEPPASSAEIEYEVQPRAHGNVALLRWCVTPDGTRQRIEGRLTSFTPTGRARLDPTQADLEVDHLLAAAPRGELTPRSLRSLLRALDGRRLDVAGGKGQAPTISRASRDDKRPIAVIDEAGAALCVRIEAPPDLTEVIAHGIGLFGETVCALAEMDLCGSRWERLPLVQMVDKAGLGQFVARVLPDLEQRMSVDVRTARLPRRAGRERPWLDVDVAPEPGGLSVMPLLVYGRPPRARIDAGQLVHLSGDIPTRDEPEERRLVAKLRDELNLVLGKRVAFRGEDAARFIPKLEAFSRSEQADLGGALPTRVALLPRLRTTEDGVELEFVTRTEGTHDDPTASGEATTPSTAHAVLDAAAVVRAWQAGLHTLPLGDASWAELPLEWLERYGDVVADLIAARGPDGKLPKFAAASVNRLCAELGEPAPPAFARLGALLEDFGKIPDAPLPSDLRATLRPYQRVGVSWLCALRDAELGAVLADDMGLGKTLQAMCAFQGRVLVVCPKSVLFNWARELRHFRPDIEVHTYHGPSRTLSPDPAPQARRVARPSPPVPERAFGPERPRPPHVTLTTYALLRLDREVLEKERWDIVVLDEAQAIKNPDSQVSRAAYALKASFRFALTGTPIENRLEELWSVFHFALPGLLGGRTSFTTRYEQRIQSGSRAALARLRELTRPFLLRRDKRQVAPELPPRTDIVLDVELDEDERRVYDAIHVATKRETLEKLRSGGNVITALEQLLRLRQAACHRGLVPGQHAQTSSKLVALLDTLQTIVDEGHRSLVFSQWTSLLDLVEPHLNEAAISYLRLDGRTRDREGVVTRFQEDSGPPVLLTTLKAGGTGLNLTAADHVFLLDPWWNPATEDQAADRAHRIGQDKPVMVYRLVARQTVEEGIIALQERKRGLASAAVAEGDLASSITREDLIALLE